MDYFLTVRTIISDESGKVLKETISIIDVSATIGYQKGADIEVVKEIKAKPVANGNGDIEARNKKIMKMFKQGYSRREIADTTGLSYQTVYGITKKMAEES